MSVQKWTCVAWAQYSERNMQNTKNSSDCPQLREQKGRRAGNKDPHTFEIEKAKKYASQGIMPAAGGAIH